MKHNTLSVAQRQHAPLVEHLSRRAQMLWQAIMRVWVQVRAQLVRGDLVIGGLCHLEHKAITNTLVKSVYPSTYCGLACTYALGQFCLAVFAYFNGFI